MADRYSTQINFIVTVDADTPGDAANQLRELASKRIANEELGFGFRRETDEQTFLAVDGVAVRIPSSIGAAPALPAFNQGKK